METIVVLAGGILMVLMLGLILVPAVPVTVAEWAMAMLVAALTQFERVTPGAALLMTGLMALSATSGLWLPLLGLRGSVSCMGMIAFFVGMLAGSALIPIPFVGTIVGGVIGVILIELLRQRNTQAAMQSGQMAAKMVVAQMILELTLSGLVIVIYLVSVLSTG